LNTDGLGYQTRQELVRVPKPYGEQVELLLEDDETNKPTEGACREVAREIKSGYEMGELVLLLERQK
jgi:hypothetical protein